VLNLVSQVLEPTIGNYFRNSAQGSDVIDFLSTRTQRQDEAKSAIKKVLDDYNVNAVDTLIGDIVPPDTLMKTLTDRKIAQEEQKTFDTQKLAQVQRQGMEKETAIADMQKQIVTAAQGVEIAERTAEANVKKATGDKQAMELNADGQKYRVRAEAEAKAYEVEQQGVAESKKITALGIAEAGKIKSIGESTAEAYKLQVAAMGESNFASLKIATELANGSLVLTPEVLISGGGEGGSTSGLVAMQLLEMIKLNKEVKG
jgi:regulator of protease activity HflC (stomatin/prohibitin superfamily)